jgi:amino acid adenylation domain-containing protein
MTTLDRSERLKRLSPEKRAALLEALRRDSTRGGEADAIPRLPAGAQAPASFSQQRLWLLDRIEPGSPAYNLSLALGLHGALDVDALSRALTEVVRRHAVLRTVLANHPDDPPEGPVQLIQPAQELPLPRIDLGALPETARRTELDRLATEDARRAFDLERGPLFRAALLLLDAGEHALLLALHHAVTDGWSNGLLISEVGALYAAFRDGRPSPLPEPPIQYADFAAWQRSTLQGRTMERLLGWWRQELAGMPPALDLPSDRPRPARALHRGGVVETYLSRDLFAAMEVLGRRRGATPFAVLLAAFQAVLHRWSGARDIAVGTPVANRERPEIEGLIGFFVNTLVLRGDLTGAPTFAELLDRTQRCALAAQEHAAVPFEKLVEELRPERQRGVHPLFQVALVFQNAPRPPLELAGLTLEPLEVHSGIAKFDLMLFAEPGAEGLRLWLEYDRELFEEATALRLLGHLGTLLAGAVERPETRVSELPLLTGEERRQLLTPPRTASPDVRCLHERFDEVAARQPGRTAVTCGDAALTYAELRDRANSLAARLAALGVAPESLVAVCLERSVDMVVSLLAVLKAGAAYLPLDPVYPAERLAFMLDDAAPAALIARRESRDRLGAAVARLPFLTPAEGGERWESRALTAGRAALPENLAYVIYTSGSTGRPKGVQVTHAQASRLFTVTRDLFDFGPDDVWTLFHSYAFDFSVWEIWGALLHGGRLVVVPQETTWSSAAFRELLAREEVTVLNQTPSAFAPLARLEGGPDLPALREVIFGGEALDPGMLRLWWRRHPDRPRLVNMYGITETTVHVTFRPVTAEDHGSVIGRPLTDLAVYLLDAAGEPVPAGVPGEIRVGGEGVSRGYLRRPELTAERFGPDPFSGIPGARLYRSGDLARRLPAGGLESLGRIDSQVKIRGFRIELGEIEAALGAHPRVARAAVTAVPDPQGDPRLAAYVVLAGGEEDCADLRDWLRERLPVYMVPALWVVLPELPLSPSGKVDRRALPAPEGVVQGEGAHGERMSPRTPTEEVIAGIWAGMLGLGSVGVHDNFFELGGHSLLANRISGRVQDVFGVPVPLALFFDTPTVAALASAVEAGLAGRAGAAGTAGAVEELEESVPSTPRPGSGPWDLPLSFAQERLWILDRFEPGSPNFNITGSVRLRGDLDVDALRRALEWLVERHESLRTTFAAVGGQAAQRIAPAASLPLPVLDLRGLGGAERRRAMADQGRAVAETSFDLARGPLLRVVLLRTGESEHALLLATHHIISDGWSLGVLIRELTAAYAALARGEEPVLEPLPLQYADYAAWQRRRLTGGLAGDRLAALVGHWRERLAGAPPALELPTDRPRPAIRSFRGGRRPLVVAGPLAGRLRALTHGQGVSLFMLLLAAFEVVLSRLSGQEDVVVGTPTAGRTRPELEGLFGMFLNTLVLRTDLSGDPPFTELLARVRRVALDAYAHQELPFEKLLDELKPERDLSRTPLFQVFFNMLNFPAGPLRAEGLTVEPMAAPEIPAKFDLTVYVSEPGEEIRFDLVYNADLFADARIAELARQLETVLEQVAAAPETRIAELSLVTEAARVALPDPRGVLDPAWHGAVHEIFADWARREPERLAVTDKDESWTYGELDVLASRLARRLRAAGVGRGDVVAIYGHRSARVVWAVLGVMKAGAAFTVLDPAHPPARIADCLRFAAPRGWIAVAAAGAVPPSLAEQIAAIPCRVVLPLPGEDDPEGRDDKDDLAVEAMGPEDLAYVAFTSGSTGVPKGILGRHGPLSHFVPWQRREFDLRESDRYSMLSGLAHDPLQRDMFTPLQTGGTICVPDPADIATPGRLAEWMRRERVTVAHLTPAMGQILTELPPEAAPVRLDSLRWAFFVGDVLTRRDVTRLRELAPGVTCVNFYGSTETQRAVAYHQENHVEKIEGSGRRATGSVRDSLPLGRGMRDVQLLVLTRTGSPAGVGEIGEIHVRSPHLARGYLGDPAGTAARFVPDPAGAAETRLYRTGDLGRYLPDGEVEFAGRADFQVKIRGFRIEPGEIEAWLARHPAVRESVVVARDANRGEKRLVAYFVPQGEAPGSSELRAWLKERLPEAMIPAAFVPLERLPLNANGKVDRRALPEPREEHREADASFEAPRNETERTIAAVLLDVLQIEKIGVNDNFFELGGNSLLLVRAHARLRELLGPLGDNELQVIDLFSRPTVASLAEHLSGSRRAPAAVRQSDERTEKIEAGQSRLRAMRQRQQTSR